MQQTVCRLSADCDLKCSLELTPDRQPAGRRPGGLPSNQDMVRACSVAISPAIAFRARSVFHCHFHVQRIQALATPTPLRIPDACPCPVPGTQQHCSSRSRAVAKTMNGMNAPFAPPGAAWQEHRTADGRVYYYNPLTKVTQWTKPEDLMSPAEVRMLCFQTNPRGTTVVLTRVPESSARSQTSHGRSTRPRAVASTGTIPSRSRARGRCQMSTSGRWLAARQPRLHQREHRPQNPRASSY
jgi:hypothetical protein